MGNFQEPASRKKTGRDQPLLIENIYEKETTDSFVEKHFRERQLHRCRYVAEFDVQAIVEQHGGFLVRSAQELQANPSGKGVVPQWTMLVFRQEMTFWHFVIKATPTYGAQEPSLEYTLVVTSDSTEKAASDAQMLTAKFVSDDSKPGFFMIRDVRRPKRIALNEEYLLDDDDLDLHYGKGFAKWSDRFAKGLSEAGLSILRGKPGTGKTSFLRHLILDNAATHRFYYLPADCFNLLQGQMSEFLGRERKRYKDEAFVLVLEDAETLLIDRRGDRDSLASSLLNFTDGFVGDMIQAHMICTINSEFKELDAAILRPGRQRFFREFDLLEWEQARELANRLGVSLSEMRSYTLAELYHFKDLQNNERLAETRSRTIGFNLD